MIIRKQTLLASCYLAWTLLIAGTNTTGAHAQTPPATTAVTDTIYRADGTGANGTVLISWPAFTLASGASIPAGTQSIALGAGGALAVDLVPNAGSSPMGSYYTVVYHLDDGSITREYWVVPAAPATVHLAGIRSTVLPASVALQTVSKSYVDTAIIAATSGHPLDTTTPYVLKAGDTMTGALVLPGDPAAPLEASDKNYVDTQVAGLQAGLGQKVSTNPQATQQVAQPAGTDLETNNLNGQLYASQYATGPGNVNASNNGIANAAASPDCANGCAIVAEHSYASPEQPAPTTWNNGTVVEDQRNGQKIATFLNPQNPVGGNNAQTIDLTATETTAAAYARTGGEQISYTGLQINTNGLTGGNNEFPRVVQGTFPYGKSTYSAMEMYSLYNTPGQHVQSGQTQHCYGIGDCLLGAHIMTSAGGFRDDADEGTHPFDIQISEDVQVFQGSCASGCTTGATTLTVGNINYPKTQGEGRYLIDTNPAKVITSGTLIGGLRTGRQPQATFAGTSFAVSTFLETAQAIPSQANDIRPGTVNVALVTTGVPPGFATNTAALPTPTGVACIADATNSLMRFETTPYTVVDSSHLQLTLQHPHQPGATVSVGGLCGYGLEQTVDTLNGIRQVFPVIGSTSATTLLYAGGNSAIVGQQGFTSAYANFSLVVASIARAGNVVTVTVAGNFPRDPNGLGFTVQGVADSSYNGSYVVTTTGPNTLQYTDNGPDSSSSGGSLSFLTGGYALYPMAEVIGVYNAMTKAVDGQLTLTANTVPWAMGDPVEEPHYFQELVQPDVQYIYQTTPRPTATVAAGITYSTNNGPGLVGWQINNAVPASSYFGNGGTHVVPDIGVQVTGAWTHAMTVEAGESSVIHVNCNSHGCNKWNSGYSLFLMDTGVGQDAVSFAPQSSTLNFALRGTGYQFTPQAFTAGTINVTTLNAGSVHGLFTGTIQPASLPVFAASGAQHSVGAVPDPGATAGTSRFLREDGAWAAATPTMPQHSSLLAAYLMNEGAGTTLTDSSGQGNNATIAGPTWEGAQDLNFINGYNSTYPAGLMVALPGAINAAQTFSYLAYFPIEGSQAAPLAPGYGTRQGFSAIMGGTTQQHLNLLASLSERTSSYKFHAFNTDNTQAGEFMPAGWHVFTLVCGRAGVPAHEYYDGAEVGSYVAQGQNTCPVQPAGNYVLGGSPAYSSQSFTGKFAGMWAWSTALSASDVALASTNALALLDQKGIVHNYRAKTSAVPQILVIGDSRSSGYTLPAGADWPDQMSLTDSSYVRTNLAVPSQQTGDMCNQFDLAYASHVGRASAPVITTIWAGMSDLQVGQTNYTQMASYLKCMVRKAKVLGRVVLATEISGAGQSTDATRDALNAILRAQAYSWGVDNLAELATEPHLGADGAANNTACFPDNLHPSTACEPYITSIMQNAVNELLGSSETQRHQSAATTYQELAGDRFLDLVGTSAQSVALPDCTGYSLPRQVLNLGGNAATVGTVNGQTLLGAAGLLPNARAVFLPVPNAPGTAGCKWERT